MLSVLLSTAEVAMDVRDDPEAGNEKDRLLLYWQGMSIVLRGLYLEVIQGKTEAFAILVPIVMEMYGWCLEHEVSPYEVEDMIGEQATSVVAMVLHHVHEHGCTGDCLGCDSRMSKRATS